MPDDAAIIRKFTERRIAGYLFHRDGDRLLTYRKSWRSYAVGCVIAATVFLAILIFILFWLRSDHTFYIGGGRHLRGRPVAPADQTRWQFTQATVLPCVFYSVWLIPTAAYVIWGSEEQRNPFTFDRQRNRVSYGRKELCNLSAIIAIRLVEARSGTGIFARLNGSPWSIELGCFSGFDTAQRFAEEISCFLNVGLYDDPIARRPKVDRGFEVVAPPPDPLKLPERSGR
jgi:hypothetical protein